MKFAFVDIRLNVNFSKFLKNFSYVFFIFLNIIVINENIVQINHDEFIEIIHQYIVDKILKRR